MRRGFFADVLFWLLIERLLAADGAELVGFPLIFCFTCRCLFVHVHPTNWVLAHFNIPPHSSDRIFSRGEVTLPSREYLNRELHPLSYMPARGSSLYFFRLQSRV